MFYNNNLTSFDGLDKLNSIEEGFELGAYIFGLIMGNPSLTSLTGLHNLTSIGGSLKIRGCDVLVKLSGLDNIDAGSIDNLTIMDNPSLTTCAIQSICDYLASPNGTITIQNNASGCGDEAEVAYACETLGVPDINLESEFSIYPNPAKNKLFISSRNELIIDEVIIYNQIGQKVLQEDQIINVLDISVLQQGIYVIELLSNELILRKKLIIE